MADVVLPAANAYEKTGTVHQHLRRSAAGEESRRSHGHEERFRNDRAHRRRHGIRHSQAGTVRRGRATDMGQSRGAQSGEADRHAVWLEAHGLEPKMSPFEPTAILDEIQRLVPGYDVSRINLLAGNDQHTTLVEQRPGRSAQAGADPCRRTTLYSLRHTGPLFQGAELGDRESSRRAVGSRGGLRPLTQTQSQLLVLTVSRSRKRIVQSPGVHRRVASSRSCW